jgi:hypothetical protein
MRHGEIRHRLLVLWIALVALLLVGTGCRSLFTLAAYMLKSHKVEADYSGLQGKKVAVVCRVLPSLEFNNPTVTKELSREIAQKLAGNVKKVQIVDPQKVAAWVDANQWNEYPEVGNAVGAEMVVGVDIQDFATQQSHTLYQGRAGWLLTVHDCTQGGKVVYEKSGRTVYPPNTGIPAMDVPSEATFRRKFVRVLADQIARHFFAHEPEADMTLDRDAM